MLIRKAGSGHAWHAPQVMAYTDEQMLQALLQRSPHLLPGSAGTPMAVASELEVAGPGYVDLVGVDASGGITLVECKLRANPDIRRQVVGQVLAYAAALAGLPYEAFDRAFAARAGAPLAQRVQELGPEAWDEEAFRAAVAATLAAGSFRLVIAVDRITDELKRTVVYLNQHTVADVQVLALELGYVADEGVEILLPAVYGQESSQTKVAAAKQKWDEAGVFAALAGCCTPQGVQAAQHLYDHLKELGASFAFGVGPLAAATARLPVAGKPASVVSFYEYPKGTGVVAVNFEYLVGQPPSALGKLAGRLRAIPGVKERYAGLEEAGFRKRPGLPLDQVLGQPGAVEAVEAALDEFLQAPALPATQSC
jgi:hypothetical protein